MKRPLTMLLSAAMALSLLPSPAIAFAAEEPLVEEDVPAQEDAFLEGDDSSPGANGSFNTQSDLTPNNDADGSQDPVGTAKLSVDFGYAAPDTYRNTWQYTRGGNIAWLRASQFSSGAFDLINSEGKVVRSVTNSARPRLTDLPAGTYTIRLTVMDSGKYKPIAGVVNGGPVDFLLTEYETEVELEEGKELLKWVVLENTALGFKTTTNVGTFEGGTTERVYYEGWNGSFANTDPTTKDMNPILNTHNGIYYGDSMSLYSNDKLEVPTLSAEEAAKGYTFVGWRLAGDESGTIFTADDAVNHKLTEHTTFEAVWDYPTHNVTFSTNTELGTIGGKASYSYTKDFNNQLVDDIPQVNPAEGYEFVGWYTDLTTNVVPEATIRQTKVDRDLHYFAKYRSTNVTGPNLYNVTYLPGEHGTLSGRDTLTLKSGSYIPTIPEVTVIDGMTFVDKWKVISISEDSDLLAVGDELTELQLSRVQVEFDLILEAVYEKNFYTVIYLDGANNSVFMPLTHEDLEHGVATPDHGLNLVRDGHEFAGWDKPIEETVTKDMVYTAQWVKVASDEDTNNNDGSNDPEKESEKDTDKDSSNTSKETQTSTSTAKDANTEPSKTTTTTTGTTGTADTSSATTGTASRPASSTVYTTTGGGTTSGGTTAGGITSSAQLAKTGDVTAGFLPYAVAGLCAACAGIVHRRRK